MGESFLRALNRAVCGSFAFIFLILLLQICLRICFIFMLGGEFSFGDVAEMLFKAARFDLQIIAVLGIIFFFIALFLRYKITETILKIFVFLVIFSSSFVGVANIGFYEIYGDVFNANLLGLIFDDRIAILQTALKGDFGIFKKIILWLVLTLFFYFIFRFFINICTLNIANKFASGALFIAFFLFNLFCINGHIGFSGISLGKEITPLGNNFLRKITFGAWRDLGYVYKSYVRIKDSKFSDYIDEPPLYR